MQERCVTIDRDTHTLSDNFTVFATQNPIEHEGTYPLPEAQKDRFMLKISMSAPSRDEEYALAQRMLGNDSPEAALASGAVQAVIKPETCANCVCNFRPSRFARNSWPISSISCARPARTKAYSSAPARAPRKACS
jgi:hypothetical protein